MVVMMSVGVGPMPLNSAKLPSPCRKKRSIGIMRSIALSSAVGGTRLRAVKAVGSGGERGPQRQKAAQQSDQRPGIAADVAAVGQDLARELLRKPLGRGADVAVLGGPAQGRIGGGGAGPEGGGA